MAQFGQYRANQTHIASHTGDFPQFYTIRLFRNRHDITMWQMVTYLTICAEQEVHERGFAHGWWTQREVPRVLACGVPERLVGTVEEERAELFACTRENEQIPRA